MKDFTSIFHVTNLVVLKKKCTWIVFIVKHRFKMLQQMTIHGNQGFQLTTVYKGYLIVNMLFATAVLAYLTATKVHGQHFVSQKLPSFSFHNKSMQKNRTLRITSQHLNEKKIIFKNFKRKQIDQSRQTQTNKQNDDKELPL